ncbi:MAG: DNA adenine methylase, partial [candidate division Zixibacteria bacterium]|nr:DNA adenine methylase [candidate division Zixibacteria bacterium]
MRYIGSKTSIVGKVYEIISKRVPSGSFCDPFGGIGVVGAFFKKKGYTVWTGDILKFAHYFQIARVELNRPPSFNKLCAQKKLVSPGRIAEILNSATPKSGWFVKEYSKKRPFFTKENAMRIEACWGLIDEWCQNGWLTYNEVAVLLASLVNSMDKVANTAATYYAALKQYYRKAIKPFKFELLEYTPGNTTCRSFLCDAAWLVSKREFDVLYLDPPYNSRCYGRYYHLPETIAHRDMPKVNGKAGIPTITRAESQFNRVGQAESAISKLLVNARFKLLAFHYADNGLINSKDIKPILAKYGKVE